MPLHDSSNRSKKEKYCHKIGKCIIIRPVSFSTANRGSLAGNIFILSYYFKEGEHFGEFL